MSLVALSLESLPAALLAQMRIALKQAMQDCEQRPSQKKPRKLSLVFEITPKTRRQQSLVDEGRHEIVFEGITVDFEVRTMFPSKKLVGIDCGLNEQGEAVYNPDSPHNHLQQVFPELTTLDGSVLPLRQQQW